MGRRRAALAAGAALIVVVAAAGPAQADPPQITLEPPSATYTSDFTVSGEATHDGDLDADMDEVELSWRSRTGHPSAQCTVPGRQTFPGGSGVTTVTFSQRPGFPCNGRYEIQVEATSRSNALHGSDTATLSRDYWLAIPPARVTGLQVSSSGRQVELAWDQSPEPDRVGYLIDRRVGSGSYVGAYAVTTGPSFTDDDLPAEGGEVTYRVWSVRLGPAQNPDDVDDYVSAEHPSAAASADFDPAPTTTEPDGGSGGGSGDGGSGGGGGSGSGAGVTIATTPVDDSPAPRADLSGFAALQRQVDEERRLRSTTTDPGFAETLPYEEGGSAGDTELASGRQDRSTFEEVVDRKAVLVPIAAGLLLFVGALQLRYLARRARPET